MDRWLIVQKKISVYVKNKNFTPSSYYRVIQYMECLPDEKILIREAIPDELYQNYINRNSKKIFTKIPINLFYYFYITVRIIYFLIKDVIDNPENIVISKALVPRYSIKPIMYLLDNLTKKVNLIWDYDDNILENRQISKKEFYMLEKNSDHIIVTSDTLKQLVDEEFRKKVLILPTTDGTLKIKNIDKIIENRKSIFESKIVIVWLATSGNLVHLKEILLEIDRFALITKKTNKKRVILKVICDKPLLEKTENVEIENIKWSRSIVEEEFEKSHLGIMPLIENEFTKGKGGFKLIQYQLAGLPIIASDVGYNKSIYNGEVGVLVKNKEDWTDALIKTTCSKKVWEKYSYNSIENAQLNFSPETNLKIWKEILK